MTEPVIRDPRSVPEDDPPPPLGRWLLDRVAEDEALAQAAAREHSRAIEEFVAGRPDGYADPDERADMWNSATNEEVPSGNYYAGVWAGDGITRVALLDESHTSSAEHFARHDPARVLVEVAAKRRMVELHTPKDQTGLHLCPVCVSWELWRSQEPGEALPLDEAPCDTLRLLALPYADHPTYRVEWRP